MMFLGGQTTDFHMYEYLPFLPIVSCNTVVYSTGFDFSYRLLISQVASFTNEGCKTNRSLRRTKLLEGRLGRVLSHCSPPSRFNVSLNCVLGGAQDCICMDDLFSTYYNLL